MVSTMSAVYWWVSGGLAGLLLLMEARWRLQNYRFEQRRKRYPQIYAYKSKIKRSSTDIPPVQRSIIVVQLLLCHTLKALFYVAYELLCRGVCLYIWKTIVNKLSSRRLSMPAKERSTHGVLQQPPSGNRVGFVEHSNGQVQTKRIRYDPRAKPSSNPTSVDIRTPPGKQRAQKPSRRATPKKVPKNRNENKENESKENGSSFLKSSSLYSPGTKNISTENSNYADSSTSTALVHQPYKNQQPRESAVALDMRNNHQNPIHRELSNYAVRPRIPVVAATPLSIRYSKRKLADHPSEPCTTRSRLPDKRGRIALPVSKRSVRGISAYSGKRKAREEWILEDFKRTKPKALVVPGNTANVSTNSANVAAFSPAVTATGGNTPSTPAPVTTPKSSGGVNTPTFGFGGDNSSKKAPPEASGGAKPSFSFGSSSTPVQATSVTGNDAKPSFSFGASSTSAPTAPTVKDNSIPASTHPTETTPPTTGPSGTTSSSAGFTVPSAPVTPAANSGTSKTAPSLVPPAATLTPAPPGPAPTTPAFSFGGSGNATPGASTAPTTPAPSFSFGGGGATPVPATPAPATPGFAFGASANAKDAGSTPAPSGGFSFNAGSTPAPPAFNQSAGGGAVNAARGRRRQRRKGRL